MVRFVVTEHPSRLTAASRRQYEDVRGRLERVAARRVECVHYLNVRDLRDAESLVLSGSRAPWAAHDADSLEHLGAAVCGFEGHVLGICAGMQLQAMFAGGTVDRARLPSERGAASARSRCSAAATSSDRCRRG